MNIELDRWILATDVGAVEVSYRETPDGYWQTVIRDQDGTPRFVLPTDCEDAALLAGIVTLVEREHQRGIAEGKRLKTREIHHALQIQPTAATGPGLRR